jgi:TolB-like protein/DNA-binding winged helix-turn-helix (wHTH) protein/Tfp pilus assembly protein PilF
MYEFGPFRLDPDTRVLLRDGKVVSLTPKVADLLVVLVEKSGQTVTKDELMKAVWQDTFVEEGNLTSNISILRKQLGECPEGGEYIETIPKRGYRFASAVRIPESRSAETTPELAKPVAGDGKRSPRAVIATAAALCLALLTSHIVHWRTGLPSSSAAPRIQGIAVLPLANLSGDPAQEYFSDGITEALISDLAQIRALRVISRASVMQFKATKKPLADIARQLRVDAVVVGSVASSGRRVRITAELIHGRTERHIWARKYERDAGDILDLQNEIARTIAAEIQAKVTPREQERLSRKRAVDPDAYVAYLRGRHHWSQYTVEALLKSVTYFEEAVRRDPYYAEAYAELSLALGGLQYIGAAPAEEVDSRSIQAASKALELDNDSADAHAAMAAARAKQWDWAGAERHLKRAFELNPGHEPAHVAYSTVLRHRGRIGESILEAKRAVEAAPLSAMANETLGNAYLSARQHDLAIAQYQKTLELYPNKAASRKGLGWAYVYKGMYDNGIEEIQKSFGEPPELSPELAYVHAMRGNEEEARQILNRLLRVSKQKVVEPHHFALIYAGLGRNDQALVMLEQAYRQHSPMMRWLKVDPRFDKLRPDPRFQELMRRVGL